MISSDLVSTESLLFVTLVSLYFADLTCLLHVNEVIFYSNLSGQWHTKLPSQLPQIARRFLACIDPLRPDTVILRVFWPPNSSALSAEVDPLIDESRLRSGPLRIVAISCYLLMVQLFGIVPAIYYVFGEAATLLAIGCFYIEIIVLLGFLVRVRRGIELTAGALLSIAFESLLCPPFAINLYRKLATKCLTTPNDVVKVATTLLKSADLAEFCEQLTISAELAYATSDFNELPEDVAITLERARGVR